ncbi:MAG: AAA family ATPase [Acidimicrobiia bacterium]
MTADDGRALAHILGGARPLPNAPEDSDGWWEHHATEPAPSRSARDVDRFADAHLVDWATLWAHESGEEWLVEPIIPARRGTAIVAGGKTGKSLLLLDVAAAFATGRPILGRANHDGPRHVLYLDYEMTEDDLRERLEAMGYGPDADLSHLHYAALPAIDPLDTAAGGQYVVQLAHHVAAELVVIDTLARAVGGEENDADTYRAFYMNTGALLKQAGITMVRVDHVGHSAKERARGSSAKADDVDLVWLLTVRDDGLQLKHNGICRVSWVPPEVNLRRDTDPLRHVLTGYAAWPAGTREVAERLDQLEAPLDISKRKAVDLLREVNGKAARGEVVAAALKFRRQRIERGEP